MTEELQIEQAYVLMRMICSKDQDVSLSASTLCFGACKRATGRGSSGLGWVGSAKLSTPTSLSQPLQMPSTKPRDQNGIVGIGISRQPAQRPFVPFTPQPPGRGFS